MHLLSALNRVWLLHSSPKEHIVCTGLPRAYLVKHPTDNQAGADPGFSRKGGRDLNHHFRFPHIVKFYHRICNTKLILMKKIILFVKAKK